MEATTALVEDAREVVQDAELAVLRAEAGGGEPGLEAWLQALDVVAQGGAEDGRPPFMAPTPKKIPAVGRLAVAGWLAAGWAFRAGAGARGSLGAGGTRLTVAHLRSIVLQQAYD